MREIWEYTLDKTDLRGVMKRENWVFGVLGFAVVAFLGTVLHFAYEWLKEAWWIAPFSGVNESTWEHMKLMFWPMILFAVTESFFYRHHEGYWCIKLRGVLLGLALIPLIFYTYNGVIGKSPDWVNISIFFVTAAVAFIYETKQLNREKAPCKSTRVALISFSVIALLFIVFTFAPPKLAIFKDPLTGSFGI